MTYQQHTLRFQFQEASDAEMTPPCPTQERSNPFDDLAPPGAMMVDVANIDPATHDPHMFEMQRRGDYADDQEMQDVSQDSKAQEVPRTSDQEELQSSRQDLLDSFKSFSFSLNSRSGLPTPPTPTYQGPGENAGFRRALEQSRMQGSQNPKINGDLFSPPQNQFMHDDFDSPLASSTPKLLSQTKNVSSAARYKIPPPLPLRLGRKDNGRSDKKVEPGQGLMVLPSPVVKSLRGEANGGYPSQNVSPGLNSLPDSPDRRPNDVKQSIQQSVMKREAQLARHKILSKRPPTPPHTPGDKVSLIDATLLSPAPVTPLSPETPDRKGAHLQPSVQAIDVINTMSDDHEEEAPEFSVAQKVLSEHPLDPGFLELYEIRDELGSGGFGFVCSAWSKVENVEVAVKFIYKNKLHQKAVVKDWHRRQTAPGILHRDRRSATGYRLIPMEAAILQFVQHPGIVNFKGLFEDSTFFYLIQELHGSPWTKHKDSPDQPQYATFMGPHSAGAHIQSFAESFSANSLSASTASFYSETSEMDQSHSSRSTFSDLSVPSTPHDPSRRGSAPETSLGPPPTRPPLMQRRSSHDLFECIEANDRFDENKAKYIFKQVVDAVAYLHRNGVCHRDIKDENIVIDDKLSVKLIDFGSAVCYDARFEPPYYDRFFGTLNFASSEILQGCPYQAAPAEVWSLGVLLSILLTGVPPFETQRDAVHGRIRLKHSITKDAHSLIQRCLHPNPRSRYTIEQVKRHRWFAREGSSRLPFSLLDPRNSYKAEQAADAAAEARRDVLNGARPMLYKGGSS